MCRWMAWLGQPVLVEELLFQTDHGIVDQSLHARIGAEPTNGDGFGLGWYGPRDGPALFRSATPAWGDENLRELTAAIESPLFLAHVRAATGTPVQQTNCHPFRYGRWIFVHNGYVADLLPGILLARVGGASPVEYLTTVREGAPGMLLESETATCPLLDRWLTRAVGAGTAAPRPGPSERPAHWTAAPRATGPAGR